MLRDLPAVLLLTLATLAGSAAAGGDAAPPSPLEACWAQAANRTELAPCLMHRLRESEDRLAGRQADVEREAAELDRVTGGRHRNLEHARASDAAWRAYRDAECGRQSAAMQPGTGSGDVLLACRIVLTETRARTLTPP